MKAVHGYSIQGYGTMVADKVRMNAYAEALRKAVRSDSVVLDIGAGTGVLTMLACQYGARHVYAVEPDDSIHIAREMAKLNGYSERITFFQDLSSRIELPERADIIVSDLRGTLPFFQHHIPSISDARARFMAPGGVLIPQQDTVWACPVEAEDIRQELLAPWGKDVLGLDLSSRQKTILNSMHSRTVLPEHLLSQPAVVAKLDYRSIEEPNFKTTLNWTAERNAVVDGVSMWFNATLSEGIGYSTAPQNSPMVYGMALVLMTEPVAVAEGDKIELELSGNLVSGSYVWQWHTRVFGQENPGQLKAEFRQSSFDGKLLVADQLRKQALNFVPALNEAGELEMRVLSLMDGRNSLEDIARRLAQEAPDQYANWKEALEWIGKLSLKFSR